ncbi:DUF423 domain-containing protein [Candidatus Methylospira mobilis]|uniref:DUF423 domain-containing protein n=1 Tax=Candidatus Methylospira mobilis TaxID=1808979 RepID=A0A5Q0BFS6_9GAMM|nr:DUF423 domain-containing protein [Candidatus Methylospira mobilis]QFY41972.1 DUF423 domain-containing protein [Candidatus Methylospira mobilis]WNV02961.1 DUF423 domain-containing protein [Candidatus Methylospira mobilis]
MFRAFLLLGSISAFLAVALGAIGAHAFRSQLSEYSLSIYQTAVQYQFLHAFGLILIALLSATRPSSRILCWSGSLMVIGILLFSGSLYTLSITADKFYAIFTPMGGIAFLCAWMLLGIHAWRLR